MRPKFERYTIQVTLNGEWVDIHSHTDYEEAAYHLVKYRSVDPSGLYRLVDRTVSLHTLAGRAVMPCPRNVETVISIDGEFYRWTSSLILAFDVR